MNCFNYEEGNKTRIFSQPATAHWTGASNASEVVWIIETAFWYQLLMLATMYDGRGEKIFNNYNLNSKPRTS